MSFYNSWLIGKNWSMFSILMVLKGLTLSGEIVKELICLLSSIENNINIAIKSNFVE